MKYKKIGKVNFFFIGKSILNLGPDWPMMICLIIVLGIINIIIIIYLVKKWMLKVIGMCLFLLFLITFLVTAIKDPGYKIEKSQLGSESNLI